MCLSAESFFQAGLMEAITYSLLSMIPNKGFIIFAQGFSVIKRFFPEQNKLMCLPAESFLQAVLMYAIKA